MAIEANSPQINKNDLLNEVLKKIKLKFGNIEVGFFAGSAKYKTGKDVVSVAKQNDLGTEKIPKREFMQPAAKKSSNKIINTTVNNIASNMDEKQALSKAGVMLVNAIQKEITNLKSPPNSPFTIIKKGSSNPLIHTGLMRSKVAWKFKK